MMGRRMPGIMGHQTTDFVVIQFVAARHNAVDVLVTRVQNVRSIIRV